MKVESISLYSNKPLKKNTYKSNMRQIFRKDGKGTYWTTTYFFRSGFNWDEFIKLICSKYKNIPKVNIFDYACSCGAEADSLVILLKEKLQDKANKFFPIIAKDINPENIIMAKSNTLIGITDKDVDAMELYTNCKMDKYFDVKTAWNNGFDIRAKSKPFVRENIIFSEGDIFEDIDKLPKSNTILLCRNMWMFLLEDERKLLAKKICQHFDDTSLVILGEYDMSETLAEEYFKENSFKPNRISGIFQKKKESISFHQSFRQFVQNLKNRIQKVILPQKQDNKS